MHMQASCVFMLKFEHIWFPGTKIHEKNDKTNISYISDVCQIVHKWFLTVFYGANPTSQSEQAYFEMNNSSGGEFGAW